MPPERPDPALRRLDGDEMPRPAVRMRTPAERALDLGSKFGVAGRVSRAADQPQERDGLRNPAFGIAARAPSKQAPQHPRAWSRQCGFSARRHERNQALDPLGIVGGDDLRDHAPHRGADDMRTIDFERVHEPDRVARHVGEAIARPHRQPQCGAGQHRGRLDRPDRRHFRRQAGIAIVEANDAEAPARQALAEIVRPCGELHAEAHDEHHRLAVARPNRFIFDVDGVGSNSRHFKSRRFRRRWGSVVRPRLPPSEQPIAIHSRPRPKMTVLLRSLTRS